MRVELLSALIFALGAGTGQSVFAADMPPYAASIKPPSARRTAARSASRALRNSWPACGLKRCVAENRQAFWRSRPDVR